MNFSQSINNGDEVSLFEFRALGNDSKDNTDCFNEAFQILPDGYTLRIPSGIFRVYGTLLRQQTEVGKSKTIYIKGNGKRSVIKQMSLTDDTLLLDCSLDQVSGWGLEDFTIAQIAGASGGDAIRLRGMHRGYMKNVYVAGAGHSALRLEHCIINSFWNFCTSTGFDPGFNTTRPQYGIILQNRGVSYCSMNTFTGGCAEFVTSGNGYAIWMKDNGHGNRFTNFVSQQNKVGVRIEPTVSDYVFDGIWLENNVVDAEKLSTAGIWRPAINIS